MLNLRLPILAARTFIRGWLVLLRNRPPQDHRQVDAPLPLQLLQALRYPAVEGLHIEVGELRELGMIVGEDGYRELIEILLEDEILQVGAVPDEMQQAQVDQQSLDFITRYFKL